MRLLKEILNLMGNYHVKSGIYHYYRNEYKQAVDFLRKALRDEPALGDSDRRLARYYMTETFVSSAERFEGKEDLEAAERDYGRAVEVSPDYPDIRFRHGRVLERLGRHEDAILEYEAAVSGQHRYLDAMVALAFCLLDAGREDEAIGRFAEALEMKLRQVRDPYEKGMLRLREGMTEEAREFLKETFFSAPDRLAEHYRKAIQFLKQENWEKALEELDESSSINPKFTDLHNYRGICLCQLDRVEEGIGAFRRSAALNPDYVEARLNLAFAQLRSGQYKEAESQLEAVLALDPTQTAASVKLEELRTGRSAEARRSPPRGGAR
jgi:tetratricopeptide (TPR) repeat protein